MLKISEMAKLANTTRRTLIFYDQEDIFKPAIKNETGYRYYEHSQLYDLMYILGLRNLGIPLEEIKQTRLESKELPVQKLIVAQNKINLKIDELNKIQKVIDKKIDEQESADADSLYEAKIVTRTKKEFWCSRHSVSCTEEEVAQLFSEFYKQLDALTIMDTDKSGFLTLLSVNDPMGYGEASFRVMKEVNLDDSSNKNQVIPIIERVAGQYASIQVENTLEGITKGLSQLKNFCQEQKIKTADYLWQINTSSKLVTTGSSKYSLLEFAIIDN